jgi:hypothetical protein
MRVYIEWRQIYIYIYIYIIYIYIYIYIYIAVYSSTQLTTESSEWVMAHHISRIKVVIDRRRKTNPQFTSHDRLLTNSSCSKLKILETIK